LGWDILSTREPLFMLIARGKCQHVTKLFDGVSSDEFRNMSPELLLGRGCGQASRKGVYTFHKGS